MNVNALMLIYFEEVHITIQYLQRYSMLQLALEARFIQIFCGAVRNN